MQESIDPWILSIITSCITTSVLAFIIWLLRKLISEWITNSIRHEYDQKIENLKSSIRQKETQIEALRSGVLSGALSRQELLYKKQVSATEAIWQAVICLSPAKSVSSAMSVIDLNGAIKNASENKQMEELFHMLGSQFNWKGDDIKNAFKQANCVRPYASSMLWAMYSAYKSICINAATKCEMLKIAHSTSASGRILSDLVSDVEKYYKQEDIINLVKEALPTHKEFIEKHGEQSLHYLLEALEAKILQEIALMLKSEQIDQEGLKQAAKIIKAANELEKSTLQLDQNFNI